MTQTADEAEKVDEQAEAWIKASFRDPDGNYARFEGRFTATNMVTAYRAGFAAGLEHARKVFMAEPAPTDDEAEDAYQRQQDSLAESGGADDSSYRANLIAAGRGHLLG